MKKWAWFLLAWALLSANILTSCSQNYHGRPGRAPINRGTGEQIGVEAGNPGMNSTDGGGDSETGDSSYDFE